MSDFRLLSGQGHLGFYQSCEVTELFLCRKSDRAIFNYYTLAVFEEKPYAGRNEQRLGRIGVNSEFSLCVIRYWLTLTEAEANFERLVGRNQWSANDIVFTQIPPLRVLAKQFVPGQNGSRLNAALKNNFHAGSYLLEFFDQEKPHLEFLLRREVIPQLNHLCGEIAEWASINLTTTRDRLGNIVFQFPITILDVSLKATPAWDGVRSQLAWHPSIPTPPPCVFSLDALYDKNFMGSTIEPYNLSDQQEIIVGNLEQTAHLKLWRQDVGLILSSSSGAYLKGVSLVMNLGGSPSRNFELDGQAVHVDVLVRATPLPKVPPREYTHVINGNLYDIDKKRLEDELSFKQYNGTGLAGIQDLRTLIAKKGEYGVYMWDPFLSSADILQTLFFAPQGNTPLRAIGAINNAMRQVYHLKGKSPADIISCYRAVLDNPKHNNQLLNLEFRIQHSGVGWAFHDRFLIFPGTDITRPQVYSLGTSINSFGGDHHILQEVSHPQPVVDAFNELWEQLKDSKCLVWKFPKT